jgi:serine/threonine-protein kinase
MIGQTISHYKVIEKIGQGGMGEVYRAEDTNLSREVAIKVLPEQFTQDPQRLARFEREAKLLASLNHPNIAAIYGLEEADGVRFLALELVEGETLAERVAKGPVPVEEALEVCRQIAEGVEAAHEKGVIHRDLKPANVKVTPEGKVKILDFGLAKAFEGETPVTDISQSPTLTEEMTRAGVILGTAAYMSPEQARGEEVDKRTDIFAFGCVLYELLTGKRTFEGKTITETLGAIIHKEPDWGALPETTPNAIQFLLRQCLQKDPESRLHTVAQFRAMSETTPAPVEPISAAQPRGQPWGMMVGLVVLGAVIASLAVWLLIQPSSPEQPLNRFVITPSPSASLQNAGWNEVAISPEGRHIVYTVTDQNQSRLYLRSLDDVAVIPIDGTEGAQHPFFSPDGRYLAFFAGGKLKRIPLTGGSVLILCDAAGNGVSGHWGSEDTIVFSAASETGNGLHQILSSGGTPKILTTPNLDEGEFGYYGPQILPGGDAVIFGTWDGGSKIQVVVLSLETGEQKILFEGGDQPHYLATGHLVYAGTPGNLMAVPFDLAKLEITGDPTPVLQGVRSNYPGSHDYALSDQGTLVYIPGQVGVDHSLVWVERDGNETLVTEEKREYAGSRISPDGKQAAFSIHQGGSPRSVWIYDFVRDTFSRLTFEGTSAGMPIWSPDGSWIVYQNNPDGKRNMYRQPADRTGQPERLLTSDNILMPMGWSPDGQVITFSESGRPSMDIGILPVKDDGEPWYVVDSPANECCGRFSPDGKWTRCTSAPIQNRM